MTGDSLVDSEEDLGRACSVNRRLQPLGKACGPIDACSSRDPVDNMSIIYHSFLTGLV